MDCIVLCCVVSIVFFVLFRTSIVLYGMYVCLYSHTGYICMHTHTHSTCAMQYNLYNKHEIYIIHTCICYIIWCGIAFHAAKLSCLDPLIFPYPLQWSKLHCVVVFGLPCAVPSQEVAAEKIRSAINAGGHVAMYQNVHCSPTTGDGQVNQITKGVEKIPLWSTAFNMEIMEMMEMTVL